MSLQSQRGGTVLGFILGLVLGLAVAMSVAIYVTKVPTPFSNKNQPRTNDQDLQENQKNKDWNPNSVLQPKATAETPPLPETPAVVADDKAKDKMVDKPSDKPPSESVKTDPRPAAVNADPLGDLAKSKTTLSTPASSTGSSDSFDYLVQAGAYRTPADADAQKAKLALIGMDARVSEREVGGRTVYRVRMGPFEDKSAAERARAKMDANGIDNTLVRLQR